MGRGNLAAAIHRRMVDDNRFGYSWEERWGAYTEDWSIDGCAFPIAIGDYDCSSSTITAWAKALADTRYAHMLDGATYTGNMREVFLASGLFEWKPVGFDAEPGDLYLNIANHVAMCQGGGVLSEFCWGDNGAYGNQRGDQSGYEAYAHGYYSYPWDGILHYNGKADDMGQWIEEGGKWWYKHPGGGYTSNNWEYIGDKWYYFDSGGWMATGWLSWNGRWYYLQPETAKTGTKFGHMVTGWVTWEGKRYYLGGDGAMVTGFCPVKGKWYCFDDSGALVKDDKRITVNAKTGAIKIA